MLGRLALGLLLTFSVPLSADSGDPPDSVARFAIAEVWPWGYRDDSGRAAGTIAEFFDRIAAVANVTVQSNLRPHRRAIQELTSGEADFVMLFESPSVANHGRLVANVVVTEILLAGLADRTRPLALDAMRGDSIAFIRGTYYGEAFENATHLQKVPVNDLAQAIDMLMLGRVDAVIASDQAFYHTLQAKDLSVEAFELDTVVARQNGNLYMSRNSRHPGLYEPIREAVQQLIEDGEVSRIFALPQSTTP